MEELRNRAYTAFNKLIGYWGQVDSDPVPGPRCTFCKCKTYI